MKQIFFITTTLIFLGCSVVDKLNNQIDQNQKKSLKNSPFETAKGMTDELRIQKKFRTQYENELQSLLKAHPNDTIILKESYDFICLGCPANHVAIYVDTMIVEFQKDIFQKKYNKNIKYLSPELKDPSGYYHYSILEIKSEIKKGNKWNKNPENYGTDKCFDGGHTFFTIIYPSGKMESMYMRCWIPKEERYKIKE